MFGKTKTPTAEPESQASVLRTPTPACYASRETYDALFTFLSTICHQAHIDQSGTPLLG